MDFTLTCEILGILFSLSTILVDGACDFYQRVVPNQKYYVYSDGYPDFYERNTQCRWIAETDPGYQILLDCPVVQIPANSLNCQNNYLAISLLGDDSLRSAERYCGSGTVKLYSAGNKMAIGMYSADGGGRFACTITAAAASCDCGWRNGLKITGGHETGVNEFPFMAAIIYRVSRGVLCGSSIISSRYALSAAHCFENKNVNDLGLLVGDHNISSGSDTPYAALHRIEGVVLHPQYDPRTLLNDISIVRTPDLIQLSLYVAPVCLPFRYLYSNFVGAQISELGWGLTELAGVNADTLQEVELSVVSLDDCRAKIKDRPVTNEKLCTYAPRKDACQGDSGGPAVWMDGSTQRMQLLGIISFGKGCGLLIPSVATKVTSYLEWILRMTPDSRYCFK